MHEHDTVGIKGVVGRLGAGKKISHNGRITRKIEGPSECPSTASVITRTP